MIRSLRYFLVWVVLATAPNWPALAQKGLLKSGPMLAWSDFRECAIWVQAQKPAKVQVRYRIKGSDGPELRTAEVATADHLAHTATVVADQVQPGKRYTYDVYLNSKKITLPYPTEFQAQELWQFRKDAPAFTMAVGSCLYVNDSIYDRPGKGYGSDYQMMEVLAQAKPDAMLWLGDNTYTREADWNTRTGILHRYSHTRSLPQLQPLLASTHHYATWDDHDYGPNDADRSYWGKAMTSEIFSAFFPSMNTGLAGPGSKTSTFMWGDAQVFLLDDRWFRAPNDDKDPNRDYFGQVQLQWLKDALTGSRARFKIIANGGQLLNPVFEIAGDNGRKIELETLARYPAERERFLKVLQESGASGIILLSGDRHHTSFQKMDRPGTYPLYELTASSLTAGSHAPRNEPNPYVIPETVVATHNAALLSFSGPNSDRVLKITILKADGGIAWTRELRAAELK